MQRMRQILQRSFFVYGSFALAAIVVGCGGGGRGLTPATTATPSPSPSATASPTPTSDTQALSPTGGATASLPASSGIAGASVVFPASSNLPSGVSVTFNASSALSPPAAQGKKRPMISASALAFWEMTFSGSTASGVTFNGNVTVTIPTPSGTSGTSLLLEIFDGANLVATCAPTVSGSNTVFTCPSPQVNLGDTYWIEIISGSSLAAGCVVPIAASPAGPHLLYYTDAGNNVVDSFDVCAQPTSGITQTFTLPAGTLSSSATDGGEIRFDRFSAPGDPRVFVLGANNTIVYLDVTTAPGTVLQTLTFTGTPHHFAANETQSSPELLYVTVGNTTVESFTVSQTAPYLTLNATNANFSSPRGIGLEGVVNGTPNDALVANFGNGTVAAVNRTTLAIDSTVTVGGEPQRVTGPNAGLNCALVSNGSNATVSAVSIVAPGGTVAAIGSPIPLPTSDSYDTFLPPGTPGSGTPGYGGNTGIVSYAGGALLATCSGTSFATSTTWTNFPSSPLGLAQSNYTSTAVDSLVYVVGTNNSAPVLQGYNLQGVPVFSISLTSSAYPQDITDGP